MYKNEYKTGVFLKELYPDVEIVHPYRINEKIYDENNKLVRNYILVDFFLKLVVNDREVGVCIEFDGSQHHRMVKKWGGKVAAKEKLRTQRIRDKWLKRYCKSKGLALITVDGRKIRGLKIKIYLKKIFKEITS
jgi:hypothetical protein